MDLSYIDQACTVYCQGTLLNNVQMSQIFADSKTFVDMPMLQDPSAILDAYNQLGQPTDPEALTQFVNEHFAEAGSDLEQWNPDDWQEEPGFITGMADTYEYKDFARSLNDLWSVLGRKTISGVEENPQRHSYTPRPYPMVVPGGRFRESYYWDSYWIVRGLLLSDMHETARLVILNFVEDINNFGFVPNGARIYYLDRS